MYQAIAMRQIYYYGFDTEKTSPAPTQGGQFSIAMAVCIYGGIFATLPMRYLNKIALASFSWLIIGALTLIIVVPSVAPSGPNPGHGNRENTAYVFRSNSYLTAEAFNGLTSAASWLGSESRMRTYIMCNGLLMSQYLILVFDVPGHMAEETVNARKNVPRSIMTTYLLGSAINFALLLSYLYSVTEIKNITIPGFGITGSCNTLNGELPSWSSATLFASSDVTSDYVNPDGTVLLSAGDPLPNDGITVNTKSGGGCILSNGLPFSYFPSALRRVFCKALSLTPPAPARLPVGNVFYDAFAKRFPRCTVDEAYGTTNTTGLNSLMTTCLPATMGGCCDIMGVVHNAETGEWQRNPLYMVAQPAVTGGVHNAFNIQGIAPTAMARNGAIFMVRPHSAARVRGSFPLARSHSPAPPSVLLFLWAPCSARL